MPVLIVNDGTLWAVDYSAENVRGDPKPVDETTLFVDRNRPVEGHYGPAGVYHLSHLHIFTRAGFARFLQRLTAQGGRMHEQIFGFAIRAAEKNGWL